MKKPEMFVCWESPFIYIHRRPTSESGDQCAHSHKNSMEECREVDRMEVSAPPPVQLPHQGHCGSLKPEIAFNYVSGANYVIDGHGPPGEILSHAVAIRELHHRES